MEAEPFPGYEKYMDASAPAWPPTMFSLLADRDLSTTARMVAAYGLQSLGQPYTVTTLAEQIGVTRNTVQKALEELVNAGWAVKVENAYATRTGFSKPWWLFRDPDGHRRGEPLEPGQPPAYAVRRAETYGDPDERGTQIVGTPGGDQREHASAQESSGPDAQKPSTVSAETEHTMRHFDAQADGVSPREDRGPKTIVRTEPRKKRVWLDERTEHPEELSAEELRSLKFNCHYRADADGWEIDLALARPALYNALTLLQERTEDPRRLDQIKAMKDQYSSLSNRDRKPTGEARQLLDDFLVTRREVLLSRREDGLVHWLRMPPPDLDRIAADVLWGPRLRRLVKA